ncbi:hypothetical protein Tco_1074253 [Tanacetum coccineum]
MMSTRHSQFREASGRMKTHGRYLYERSYVHSSGRGDVKCCNASDSRASQSTEDHESSSVVLRKRVLGIYGSSTQSGYEISWQHTPGTAFGSSSVTLDMRVVELCVQQVCPHDEKSANLDAGHWSQDIFGLQPGEIEGEN